ncbi:MAG: pilus assembly protein MshP [Sulfuricaulis sp.]
MKRGAPSIGKHERGFALVMAIFIIVVLALLGIMMVTIGGMQRATATTAAQGTRAYYAARAGIEWATFQSVSQANASPSCASATGTLTLSGPGLNGFTVNVQCTQIPAGVQHREYGQLYDVYLLTSTATSSTFGGADFVSRTLNAVVTDAQPP